MKLLRTGACNKRRDYANSNSRGTPASSTIRTNRTRVDSSEIDQATQAFLAYLTLPEIDRCAIQLFDESRPRTGHHGYARKTSDDKHIFHMTQQLYREFEWTRWGLPQEARTFLTTAHELYEAMMPAVEAKYEELGEEIPYIRQMHFPSDGTLAHHLRFLGYCEGDAQTVARPHYDKGSGTVAITRSRPGLQLGFGSEDLAPVDLGETGSIFFPGFGWHQIAEMMDVVPNRRAGWHQVDNVEPLSSEVHVDEAELTHTALVLFLDPAHLYLESTKEQTHRPIPWRGKLAVRSDDRPFNL